MPGRRVQARGRAQSQSAPVVIERFVEPCMLLLLQEGAACGYELYQRIRLDCRYAAVDLPNVYRTLRQLEAAGIVLATDRLGPRQKQLYAITPEGARYLDAWMASLREGHGIEALLIERYNSQLHRAARIPGASATDARMPVDAATANHQLQEQERVVYKVVMQYNIAGREEHVLMQLEHLLSEFEADTIEIVVVAHGDGIGLISNPEYAERVMDLNARGVTFLGCAVTLKRLQKSADDLVSGASTTPGALAEIIRRQHDGYAYLRPF